MVLMQMFLEYQSVSGTGLRRMMDAPIVSTSRCHALETCADAHASRDIASVRFPGLRCNKAHAALGGGGWLCQH